MSNPSLGGNSEELVPTMTGVAPTAGLGKAKNALEALQMVKAMKAAKAAKTATKTASIMQFPKSISQSRLTNSGKTNINRILQALPETERQAVTEALLKNENFWKSYGDGIINVTPGRAASTINAIRRKLGFSGSVYNGQVSYPKHQVSGIREIEDATRRTVGFKRTTRLKPE